MSDKRSDTDLIELVARGDADAFRVLFDRHYTRVLNITYRYLGRESEAEDLAQEAFVRIWKAAERFRPEAKFTTWLFQIVANLCLNFRRDRGRRQRHVVDNLSSDDSNRFDPIRDAAAPIAEEGADEVMGDERALAVRGAMDELPESQRMALVLMYFEGLTLEEMGEVLEMKANAAKQLVFRARKSLKDRLERLIDELM